MSVRRRKAPSKHTLAILERRAHRLGLVIRYDPVKNECALSGPGIATQIDSVSGLNLYLREYTRQQNARLASEARAALREQAESSQVELDAASKNLSR